MPNESDSKRRIISPFSRSKIAEIQTDLRNDHSTEQLEPPAVPQQRIEHPHPVSAFRNIALSAITFAAVVSPATTIPVGPVSDPGISRNLPKAEETSSS